MRKIKSQPFSSSSVVEFHNDDYMLIVDGSTNFTIEKSFIIKKEGWKILSIEEFLEGTGNFLTDINKHGLCGDYLFLGGLKDGFYKEYAYNMKTGTWDPISFSFRLRAIFHIDDVFIFSSLSSISYFNTTTKASDYMSNYINVYSERLVYNDRFYYFRNLDGSQILNEFDPITLTNTSFELFDIGEYSKVKLLVYQDHLYFNTYTNGKYQLSKIDLAHRENVETVYESEGQIATNILNSVNNHVFISVYDPILGNELYGGRILIDADEDGFLDDVDCDDSNAAINPDAVEIPYDGFDNDCNSATLDDDFDQDGFILADDCNDENPNINPAAIEVPYDGIDNDCDSATFDDDLDQDGFLLADDCDDKNADINLDAIEIPNNGIDEDCDGADLITGTKDYENSGFSIYPTISSGLFKITNKSQNEYKATIVSCHGTIIKHNLTGDILDLTNCTSGLYLVQITQNNKIVKHQKLIISN